MSAIETQAIDPKVVDRIRKMLNLARNGGATEGEANAAAEAARKTMAKYNLTIAEVEAGGGSSDSKRTKTQQKGRAQYEFQQQLMVACAEVNFVIVLKNVDWKNNRQMVSGFTLIGREANVVATRELFEYLNVTTERLAFEYVGSDNKQRLSRDAIRFKTGCAERLQQRLRDRHETAMAEQAREAREANATAKHPGAVPGTALAIIMTDYAQDEADNNEDIRWGSPEGTTKARRLAQTAKGKVCSAASLAVVKLEGDYETLAEAAVKAAEPVAVSLAVTEEDMHQQVEYAVRNRLDSIRAAQKLASETPKQKAAREEKQRKDDARFWGRWTREQRQREEVTGSMAYRSGARAGEAVGLDKQVKSDSTSAKRLS